MSTKDDPLELDVPDGVADAKQAVEIIRAFIADGSLMLALHPDAFGERTDEWGRLLAEIAHHIAHATAMEGYGTQQEAIDRIRESFTAAISQSHGALSGSVRGRGRH